MSDPKVLLTQDQIDRWKKEKVEYEKTIADAQKGLAEVARKLDAAAVILGPNWNSAHSGAISGQPPRAESDLAPMTEAVLRVVREAGGTASRRAIKIALRQSGYPDSRLGNYFYTVMARHVERGYLTKDGNRYSLTVKGELGPEKSEASSCTPHKVPLDASIETGLAAQ